MGTRKSTEGGRGAGWTVLVLVFSGRPDPEWPAPGPLVRRALELWDNAAPLPSSAPPPRPALGYRGAVLREPGGGMWRAWSGIIQWSGPTGGESRRDDGGVFERLLLDSAPPGSLPPGVMP